MTSQDAARLAGKAALEVGSQRRSCYESSMSESTQSEPESPVQPQKFPYSIAAVHFDQWAPLGGPVTLSLSPRYTVLVGRNGGGKSLLLEGLQEGARGATSFFMDPRPLKLFQFRVDIWQPEVGEFLHYQYQYKEEERLAKAIYVGHGNRLLDWRELCWTKDPKQPLWLVKNGVLTLANGAKIPLGGVGTTLMTMHTSFPVNQGAESATILLRLLAGVAYVEAQMPVRARGREQITLKGDSEALTFSEALEGAILTTANKLAEKLWELFEDHKEQFEELDAVGQRIGIWQKLAIEKYYKERGKERGSTADVLAEVTVDGINLGLVSDGTLRLLKILLALVAEPDSKGPLLIDEPELGIHPGLLTRLLAEFDAYGAGRQLVIATHSPQVVSWARPDELRFVERVDGCTVVRSLTEEQASRVHSYLQDQGNLGEFVYGGGVDG